MGFKTTICALAGLTLAVTAVAASRAEAAPVGQAAPDREFILFMADKPG